MKVETRYGYEKIWSVTQERDLIRIIAEEVGDADTQGVLTYIYEAIKDGKTITVGSCKFRKQR